MNEDLNSYILDYLRKKFDINLYAVIAYGSRVAGYATESSDYDYIVIIDNFKEKIRYVYEKIMENVYAAFLIVDKIFFEEDVLEGKHGEFVSGRLYNVFTVLLNEDYVKKMEIILKSRAILEELCILKNSYGDLVKYLIIPLKYILFARLKKRMLAYPPVKYSYYKTYYGPRGLDNLNKSILGFKEAAKALDEEGLIKYHEGYIRVISDRDLACDFKEIVRILSRGFKMYITHGRSAKVDLKVVFEEIASKVKRSLESIRMPLELKEPETLLKLERGVLVSIRKPIEEIVKAFEGPNAYIVDRKRKHMFSELYFIDLKKDNFTRRIVLKKYSYLLLLKWLFIFIWLIGLKTFTVSPKRRMMNEFKGYVELSDLGVSVPEVYAVLWKDSSIVIEYLNGVTLNSLQESEVIEAYYKVGKLIGTIHRVKGVSIGDVKPNNLIYVNGDIYLVDLEQYGLDSNFSWDIGELIYYSNTYWNLKRNYMEIIKSFIEGYRHALSDHNELKKTLSKITSIRFIIAFMPLVPLNRLIKIRGYIKEYLKNIGKE